MDLIIPTVSGDCWVNSIYVSGGNVYVAGGYSYYDGSSYSYRACYWKDGETEIIDLNPEGCSDSSAYSIYVSGNNVYVSGSYYDGSSYIACYWKDGEKTDLVPKGTSLSSADSIFVTK